MVRRYANMKRDESALMMQLGLFAILAIILGMVLSITTWCHALNLFQDTPMKDMWTYSPIIAGVLGILLAIRANIGDAKIVLILFVVFAGAWLYIQTLLTGGAA